MLDAVWSFLDLLLSPRLIWSRGSSCIGLLTPHACADARLAVVLYVELDTLCTSHSQTSSELKLQVVLVYVCVAADWHLWFKGIKNKEQKKIAPLALLLPPPYSKWVLFLSDIL